ncbi:MAG: PilZ domain-containing protein [Rhodanobacteraceae bacterium]|nr:PilZ domain-containing protein [Rhodanobacteraceae bacterium]MBK7043838.1 PilZ domain-containing protein [Rhodanobacteraceae bacterium]MBP9155109.1 PilZ domain-containing protein [Xanthomonadales bacterium]
MNLSEQRLHPRKDVFTAAMLIVGDDGFLSEVWDLSAGGARLGKPKKWPTTAIDQLRVYFMLDQDTVIGVAARVVRSAPDHIGVMFLSGQEQRIEALMYEARFLEGDNN